jgi:hypothetical protein
MAPVSTIVLSRTPRARAAAVSTMVSVPCVTTMRASSHWAQLRTMVSRSASVMSRLSIIISVRTETGTRERPRRSISGRCVSPNASLPRISS